MKIQNISIHNYRSICDLDFQCESLVILLGPNNHGKSNILSAIEFALSSGTKPSRSDFNVFCDDNILWVEITFNDLTPQEKTTFKKYLRGDDTICIRKTAALNEGGKIDVNLNGYCQQPDFEWLQSSNASYYTKRENIADLRLNDYLPTTGRITKAMIIDAQNSYINDHPGITYHEALESTPFFGTENIGSGLLPDFYLIPAIHDLTEETKSKGSSIFYKMLSRTITEIAEKDENFSNLREIINTLGQNLNHKAGEKDKRPTQLIKLENSIETELTDWGVDVDIQVTPPSVEKMFEFGTDLHINDGVLTKAEDKGHGLQRALIFALFQTWAKSLNRESSPEKGTEARVSSKSVIYAIEEPELFLHPHAQKKMAKAIRDIAQSPNHQIMACSHSSHFVDLDNYKSICIVNKSIPEEGTQLHQCLTDLFPGNGNDNKKNRFRAAHWVNPDRGEMFFAKRIVFVEGETEKIIFPYLADKMDCYDPEVSIIDCGSKFNLPLYISIANAFKLNYVVIHDEDPLPDPIPEDWDDDKIKSKRRTFKFNQDIQNLIDHSFGNFHMLEPDFEGVSGVSKNQGNKKGKPLAALDHFSSIENDEIPSKIQSIVKAIFVEK